METKGFSIKIIITADHTEETKRELAKAIEVGLTKCGMNAERYAKQLCPVDTGRLRNSIVHELADDKRAVYVGTNVYYAPYVEMGTSKMSPRPFIEPSIVGHKDEHKETLKSALEGKGATIA